MADTEQPELSLERFRALVEAYGGDLERFPKSEREAARELLQRSDSARALVDAARTFDQLLFDARHDTAPSALIERLGQIPAQHTQRGRVVRLLPFSGKQTWLLAAAAVLLGVLGGNYSDSELSASVLDNAPSDISSLAFADDLYDDLTTSEGELQ